MSNPFRYTLIDEFNCCNHSNTARLNTSRPIPTIGGNTKCLGSTSPPDEFAKYSWLYLAFLHKIDFKRMYTEITFAIGSEFIIHTLDDSAPIADLQSNKKRIPYFQMWDDTRATVNEQSSEERRLRCSYRQPPLSEILRHSLDLFDIYNRISLCPRHQVWSLGYSVTKHRPTSADSTAHNYLNGATVAELLDHSPPTKAIQVQSPAGSPDLCMWESCRTLVGGFSRGYPVSPPLHSGAASYSPPSLSSALETLLLRATLIVIRAPPCTVAYSSVRTTNTSSVVASHLPSTFVFFRRYRSLHQTSPDCGTSVKWLPQILILLRRRKVFIVSVVYSGPESPPNAALRRLKDFQNIQDCQKILVRPLKSLTPLTGGRRG
ncbi:hypothetical protein PR048_006485 [Dryococelus australis]|uniref:Maturase K n=1 Tax=Dryococelus australis TaxID=614101 RepID=A0ABQ9IB35_9NEOP|nr:hypothetical protein PR048_006485 [Dryococelus australis]